MIIKTKQPGKIQAVGKNQLSLVFKADTIDSASIKKGDSVEVTVLENGSILIEKTKEVSNEN